MRLQQVLSHFLTAAIENSEEDGTVVVECDTRSPEHIRIRIDGGGAGSSAGRWNWTGQTREPLADEASATRGMGIGLLLATRIVELMGGAIGTQGGVGTAGIFSFDLKRTSETTTVNAIAG